MIIAIVAVLPLAAADIPVITLDEAIRSAGENNISIKSAEAILSRSLRNAGNAMGTFMPDLRLSAGMQAGGNFPPVTEAPEYTGLTLNAGASASFSFSGSMIKDGATRALDREAAILTFQNDTKSIEQSIITAYWTIAANKIQADNASTLAEDARTQYESTLEMYDCGISDELALNQAELAYNQAMLTVKTAEDTLENSKDVLRTLTGIDGDFSISPTVMQGYILKVSSDLVDLMEITLGKPAHVFPLSQQDITPYGNDLYHLNSILQPSTATKAPVVGVAITAATAVPGCATGASHVTDIEEAARFMLEAAKAFGRGELSFYDEKEFAHLQKLYGDMSHFQGFGRQ